MSKLFHWVMLRFIVAERNNFTEPFNNINDSLFVCLFFAIYMVYIH